ncbi:hypothetical protein BG842_24480 [Haladaptatus sp. W1]|uniref:hypothetical protein n=1 Tax=Haladaptatus sp. W1 TaxID=1897478 RepID=UPI0008497050|nr:hypothetical protein [Haladaptatus sp. W1]ODR82116.1 hypothetical protein BG842_24480 [Haladaptatus sp. W1]
MAQERSETIGERIRERGVVNRTWSSSILGGLVGGIVFGLLLQSMGVLPTVAALYGLDGTTMGWVAHLFNSVVFGLVFGAVMTMTRLRAYADRPGPTAGIGVAYGIVLWVVAASFVMPFWLGAVGMTLAVPTFDVVSLVGHVVYGVLLGAVFAIAYRR